MGGIVPMVGGKHLGGVVPFLNQVREEVMIDEKSGRRSRS
jgi:hypothetical protein